MSVTSSDLFWLPDMEDTLRRRYRILKAIETAANAGRRKIHRMVGIPESQILRDTELLCTMGILISTQGGFSISHAGWKQLKQFESENALRLRCMELEDKLAKVFRESRIHVYEDRFQVEWELRKYSKELLPVHAWKTVAEKLTQSDKNALDRKDACAEAGGVILSKDGKPLYRIEKQEVSKSVCIVSGNGITAAMLFAVIHYYTPKDLILIRSDAEWILRKCIEVGEQNAGCCD